LGGVNIGGELDKHLIIHVKMEDKYFKPYDIPLGTNIYTSAAYTYSGLEFPTAGSGVYNVEMWLDANGLESEHLSYNIICVSKADELTARLVSVSDAPKSVFNFSENKLFNYCVYNAGQSSTGDADAEVKLNVTLDTVINKNKVTIKSEDLVNVPTAQPLEYIATIETEVPEGSTMELSAVVSYGNAQQVNYPIDNSKSYPATSEVYFYLNPAQRSNTQADRESIVNAINSATYTAEWTNMAWAEGVDGWTVDEDNRKCLRIPAFSKVDIAYQPLANIKTPVTMEFVYKVKNASDYNDPIIYIGDIFTAESSQGYEYDYNVPMVDGGAIALNNAGLTSNAAYQYSKPIFLTKGESIHFNTTGQGFVAVTETNESGSTYNSIIEVRAAQTGNNPSTYISNIDYVAERDIWIRISRKTANITSPILYIKRVVEYPPTLNPKFTGIRITPKNICIHSRDLKDSSLQDYNTIDEKILDVIVTIVPNYKTNYGNLAQVYCNGVKVRSFEFSSIQEWNVLNNIILGNNTADLYVYKMRVYHKGFDKSDAMRNFVNSLPDTASREAMYAYLHKVTDDSYDVDYDTCVKNGYNTMVIEMIGGKDIPSNDKNADIGDLCNLKISIHNLVEGEIDEEMSDLLNGSTDILNQTIEGQGTTAMTYGRWNFRWKLDKTYGKRRITAKKNVASSMQSHKMGATRLFNYLHGRCVGANEADGNVAVLQYPVHGFQKVLAEDGKNYIYRYIGLYTIGADKGDKHTFGYDDARYESTLMHLEGSDHTPASVGFEYPYYKTQYSAKKDVEAMGALDMNNEVVAAWEVGAAGKYETDVESDRQNVQNMIDTEFAPAYNVAYFNSTYIDGVTATLAEMNANAEQWREGEDAEGRPYSYMEFFIDGEYELIFYNRQTFKYEYYANGGKRLNVLTDLGLTTADVEGMTLAEKTEFIKAKRRERFANQWGQYWHTTDTIFQYAFLLLFGATDNFKKNSYPYKFDSVANGGKWRWRQDDLDTIFDIDNQGLASKTYSILVGDKDNDGSIYSGDNSVFWTLVRETQEEEIKKMVRNIFDAMVAHPKAGSGSTMNKLVGCIRYCFWNFAQEYFPQSSYNHDAEWTYEDIWHAKAQFNPAVPPLKQALGGHYEAERDWVMMRLLFCASYFNYGAFTATGYDDATLGRMTYRGAGAHNYEITPAIDFNPTVLVGSSGTYSYRGRAKAGEKVTVSIPSTSGDNTNVYVMGLDWLSDVGDLSTLTMAGDASLQVVSKRLQRLKVGDEDASKIPIAGTIKRIEELDCPSMTSVDARNVTTLTGEVDLTRLARLKEAYFGGTNVSLVKIADGSKIEVLELPASITSLKLVGLKNLNLVTESLSNVSDLRIENCEGIDGFDIMKEAYGLDGSKLSGIRIIGFDKNGDATDLSMLANMINDVDKDGNKHVYSGIDSQGNPTDNPVIEGRMVVDKPIYKEDETVLKEALGQGFQLESTGGYYIKFADPEVQRICATNWGDKVGITPEQAAAVTSIGTVFNGNTEITKFMELPKFANAQAIPASAFSDCTSLKEIDLSDVTSLGSSALQGCTSLEIEDLNLPNLEVLGQNALHGVKIKKINNLGKLTALPTATATSQNFGDKTVLEEIVIPATVTTLPMYCFQEYAKLKSVSGLEQISSINSRAFSICSELSIPIKLNCAGGMGDHTFSYSGITSCIAPFITSIGQYAFRNCQSLTYVFLKEIESLGYRCFLEASIKYVIIDNDTPPTLNSIALSSQTVVYVPSSAEVVEFYKNAAGWSAYASRIFPISQLETDNPELYAEIEEYL
jgi:hypothetical protein